MEETRHWVWAKPKYGLVGTTSDDLHVPVNKASSYDDSSWEEQAFAEDASGPLGGCIWPPRSYSCSFCRREFRSAQALGGHMNVHRRDRARLKQYPPDLHREILLQNHPHNNNNNNNIPVHENINPLISSFSPTKYPSQVCALVYNPNPNSDPHHDPANFITSPSSPSPYKQSCHEKQVLSIPSCYSSSLLQENKKKRSSGSISPSSHQSWSNLATDRYNYSLNQKNQFGEIKKISSITHLESSGSSSRPKVDEYYVKTRDLSVSLNLVVCQHSCPTLSGGKEEEEEEEETTFSFKRRRTSPVDSHNIDPLAKSTEGFEISPCSIEDLDLELRLGGRPYKVN